MVENDKIQNFGDMVEATEKLTRPWRIVTIVSNCLWAIVVAMLIWFAYMTPVEVGQNQDFTQQIQGQTYSEGVTQGK